MMLGNNNRWFRSEKETPELRAAYEALRVVGSDNALRLLNAAWAEELEQSFVKTYGLKRSSGHVCLDRLLGKKGHHARCRMLPGSDHSSLWLSKGKPAVYATQPYGITHKELEEMIAVCKSMNLELMIGASSWHFWGATVLITVSAPWFKFHDARIQVREAS